MSTTSAQWSKISILNSGYIMWPDILVDGKLQKTQTHHSLSTKYIQFRQDFLNSS